MEKRILICNNCDEEKIIKPIQNSDTGSWHYMEVDNLDFCCDECIVEYFQKRIKKSNSDETYPEEDVGDAEDE